MKHSWRKIARLLALGLFALATAAWAYMSHASSCAGDIKGGTWGDPVLALAMESQAFAFGIVASCMLGAVLALSPKPRSAISRSLSFLAATVLCFIAIVVSGFFIDGQIVASWLSWVSCGNICSQKQIDGLPWRKYSNASGIGRRHCKSMFFQS